VVGRAEGARVSWRRTPKEQSRRQRMPTERGDGDESSVGIDECMGVVACGAQEFWKEANQHKHAILL
jgi:hypothetical protein